MRRFESTEVVGLRGPAGGWLDSWVADSFRARLAGLAFLAAMPPGRALLIPRCRSVHTMGMRFPLDVAFVVWPPAAETCMVLEVAVAVPPRRLVAPRGLPRGSVAVLEAGAGALAALGAVPGARLVTFRE